MAAVPLPAEEPCTEAKLSIVDVNLPLDGSTLFENNLFVTSFLALSNSGFIDADTTPATSLNSACVR